MTRSFSMNLLYLWPPQSSLRFAILFTIMGHENKYKWFNCWTSITSNMLDPAQAGMTYWPMLERPCALLITWHRVVTANNKITTLCPRHNTLLPLDGLISEPVLATRPDLRAPVSSTLLWLSWADSRSTSFSSSWPFSINFLTIDDSVILIIFF